MSNMSLSKIKILIHSGGVDNVTVIVVDAGKLPPPRPQVSMDGGDSSCQTVVM